MQYIDFFMKLTLNDYKNMVNDYKNMVKRLILLLNVVV
jgi:hypothetical protein